MNWSTIGKYAAGAAMLGSVFYLVVTKQVDPQVYVGLITGGLAALGLVVTNIPKQ